jgi:hypothetical protein
MLLLLFFLPVLALAAAGIAGAIVALRSDGYGGRMSPPRSHAYEPAPGALRGGPHH